MPSFRKSSVMVTSNATVIAPSFATNQPSISCDTISKSGITPLTGGFKGSQESTNKRVLTQIKQRNRKIVQYTIEGKVINTFDSCTEAEKSTGVSRSGITHCCLGNHKTAKGYIWKYEPIV